MFCGVVSDGSGFIVPASIKLEFLYSSEWFVGSYPSGLPALTKEEEC